MVLLVTMVISVFSVFVYFFFFLSLLVSAPHFKPKKVNSSGVYFLCDPLQQICTSQTTVPSTGRKFVLLENI